MPGKQCATWDITISAEDQDSDYVQQVFRKLCKKWTFQLERGEQRTERNPDGYLHHQCRVSFHKKAVRNSVVAMLLEELDNFKVTPSSNNSQKGEAFYCMKEQTRVDGPWTDRDVVMPALRTIKKMEECGLKPWQNDLLWQVDKYDDRRIHVIIDKSGNSGKTSLMKYVYVKKLGMLVPPMNCMEDLVQFCMNFPNKPLYVIDMPRSMPKKHLASMYAGIETIKSGILYDKRYQGRFMLMDEPNVVVCTNVEPKSKYLSVDRWKLWTIVDEELVDYVVDVGQGD